MHSSNRLPHGNCDSSRLETCPDYLTRFGTVSHRSSPPSSFFALLARANVPEELVNSASPELTLRFRGAGSTSLTRPFPSRLGLSLRFPVRFYSPPSLSVLSMNWEQHTVFPASFNELICTACSPNSDCEKPVNNSNQRVKSSDSHFAPASYSPLFQIKKVCGEQVPLVKFWKNFVRQKNLKVAQSILKQMRLPSLRATLIFAGGFASCLLFLTAVGFGGYYFWLKPMISQEQTVLSEILEPPSFPNPHPAAFNFWIVDSNNKRTDFQKYHGRVIILNFWATWCSPCQAELPSLGKLAGHYAEQDDVAVICISEELPTTILSNRKAIESHAPLYSLNGQQTPQTYKTEAIPATFVIDTNGIIVFEHDGAADWSDPSVIKFIDSLRGKNLSSTNNSISSSTNSFNLSAP
jgi:thiol-disulfide isomerase/thioredoxin